MADTDPTELLELATTTAREAAKLLVERHTGVSVVQTKTSPTDVVTEMDRASDELISARLRAARPTDAILTEESGASAGGSGVRWVVDPIDGTVNYLYGLPDWAVSIAVEVDGATAAGVVEVPMRGETFTAIRGRGAWLTRPGRWPEPMHCTPQVPLDRALIATGFGYAAARRTHQARVLLGVLPHVRDIRRGGSAAADLCSLACGRVDGYYERGTNVWDFAAGGLIAREAGARFGGLHGKPAGTDLVIAAPDPLFTALHDLLAPLDPERDD